MYLIVASVQKACQSIRAEQDFKGYVRRGCVSADDWTW